MLAAVRSFPASVRRSLFVVGVLSLAVGTMLMLDPPESSAATIDASDAAAPGPERSRRMKTNSAPTISILPAPGQFVAGQVVTVTITYCDSESLDTTTAIRRFNGVNKTWPITYTIGNPGSCLARAVTSGNVTLVAGSNTVLASIEDADPVPLWSGWSTATYITPVPWSGVLVTPVNQFAEATNGTATTQQFIVQNLGDNATTFAFTASQTGLSNLLPPTGKDASASIAAGGTKTVAVGVTAPGAVNGSGRVTLTATGGGTAGSAFTEILAVPSPVYTAGVSLVNPTGILDRASCLGIAVGPAAAAECGDLRLAYGLPGVITRGKVRSPSLVYSSASAQPFITIPADLTLTSPSSLGTTFTATVDFGGGSTYAAGSWLTADFGGVAGRRRILATFDASGLATGRRRFTLRIQMSGGTIYQAVGELLIVNRLASPFNAGWWLGGLEQVVPHPSNATAPDTVLWVGGDGSARVYVETAANSCTFTHEAFDVPEKLLGTPTTGSCANLMHLYPDSLRVYFDNAGNHIETRNRLGESTMFGWTAGKLMSVTVPSGSVSRQFAFVYTAGVLDSIIAPGLPTQARAVKVTYTNGAVVAGVARPRTTGLRGPDTATVSFGYEGGSGAGVGGYRIVARTDRMGITSTLAYDAAYKLASASTPASASQTVVQTLRAAEGQGKGTGAAGQALILDSVYTRLDGPRTDVADVNKWWINRYGAPLQSRNPVGMESRLSYDASFPALPASVIDPAGLTTVATYNSRGLVSSVVVRSPYGAADSAMTSIMWDPTWNKPTSVTPPTGPASFNTYSATTGNLLTSRVGPNTARTVQYEYDTSHRLRRVLIPGGGADSIYYDDELGNVARTKSPAGAVAWSYKDRLGRDTLIVTSVDTILGATGKQRLQRLVYDVAGRVQETRVSAPSLPYTLWNPADDTIGAPGAEEAVTRQTYDAEGRVLTVHAFSTPNPLVIADTFAPIHVESECELHCVGVPSGTVGSYDIRTYDWIGRPLTTRLGSGPQSVTYDPAGNVVSQTNRNNQVLTSTFDAAGRLIRRMSPAVTYGWEGCANFEFGILNSQPPSSQCMMTFPYFPTSGTSLVVPGDTVRFVYNSAGHMVRADNRDARITRSYFSNGALATDAQALRSYATASFTTNTYTQSYRYDLSGRRVKHGLPFSSDSVTYAYSAETGALSEIRHGQDMARFFLDLAGRQDSLEIWQGSTLGVIERRTYDLDGQNTQLRRRRWTGSSFMNLLDDTLTYDARGKLRRAIITSASADVGSQIAETHYSGLGAVVASSRRTPTNIQWETEEFRTSAIGTAYWSRTAKGSAADRHAQVAVFGFDGEVAEKLGRPSASDPGYQDAVKNRYDQAGNTTHSTVQFGYQSGWGPENERFYSATRSYYATDGKLAVSQRYYATDAGRSGAWEESRYDALGRRVLSRTRRPTGPDGWVALCGGGSCHEWIERTIWDGDNVLYEGRVNVSDTSSASAMDALSSTGLQWGLAGYVHAGGYDRPIFTMDGRVPSYNWRGLPESSVWTNGSPADCTVATGTCTTIAWPSANTIYLKPSPFGGATPNPSQWVGSVLADGAGSTGMLYRRNRYYDPASGQFTQQDPIGIAGGANVYGFAGGDPVNFADPFGLCPGINGTLSILDCPPGYLTLIGEMTGALIGGVTGGTGGASAGAALCAATVVGTVPCAAAGGAAGAAVGAKRGALIGGAVGALLDGAVAMANAGRGRGGNQNPNADANRAARDAGLNRAGQRALHDEITGQELTVEEIREIANRLAEQAKYLRNPPK